MSSALFHKNNEASQNIFTNTMADMRWTDIKHYADENAIVLLPMGVMEQHGPHLCLATDIYTAHIYCMRVKQMLEKKGYAVVIAPPFYWGICQSARGFIGSFNIRMETAKALIFDILSSLKEFGFTKVFGVNTHGDVEQKIAAMNAFKEACEQLSITACFPYEDFMLHHFGLSSNEPCFYSIKPQTITVSKAEVPDVHAGDIETATINTFYPDLIDDEIVKSLPDVALPNGMFEAWMFGGQLKELSPQGYLGSPSSYKGVDLLRNIEDNADRISEAILTRLGTNMTDKEKFAFDVILARRSVRSFIPDKQVEKEKIQKLLEAAMAAPSACNIQPWDFIVVTEASTLKCIRESVAFQGNYNSPLAIIVCGYPKFIPWDNDIGKTDCAAATQNILLAATAMDLGSVWIGGFNDKLLRELLRIPENVFPVGIIYIGYPAESHEPRTQYIEEAVYWENYEANREHLKRPNGIL